jgi:hypothetical protein
MTTKSWLSISLNELQPNDPRNVLKAFAKAQAPLDIAAVALPVLQIEIPDLSAFQSAKDKAKHLLGLAAGIEHALLAQYLYAGYSVEAGGPSAAARGTLIQIATEEMAHLMSVQNLLLLIGEAPTIKRADRQDTTADPIVPFDLTFEKLTKAALAKYIVTESPAFDAPDPVYEAIALLAGQAHGDMIKKVGLLYALLGVVFGSQASIDARANNSKWDATIKQLADEIAADNAASTAYGGRAGMHLSDSDFQSGDENAFLLRQATDSTWDRSTREGAFRVFAPKSRDEALNALRDITIQGEAPVSADPSDRSHYARFLEVYQQLYGADGQGVEPGGVQEVPTGAAVLLQDTDGDQSTLSHAAALPWARLAELRYWLLLGSLDQYLNSRADDRDFLVAWCITEMHHLKSLAKILSSLPRTQGGAGRAALPLNAPTKLPSELPPDPSLATGTHTQWSSQIQGWLQRALDLANALLANTNDPAQKMILEYMLEVDARKLVEATMRRVGNTTRSGLDQMRETLEWAAGTGDPRHGPITAPDGRFWNQSYGDLKNTKIYGNTIIATPGNQSGMLAQLQSGNMPASRAKLNTAEHQPKIDAIRGWMDRGADPNEPAREERGIQEIREIRLLPSLALARLGSSPQPMDNYTLEIVDGQDYRQIRPAETLLVNEQDGSIISAVTPTKTMFKDAMGRVKPVCPFLEVWAVYNDSDDLRPLTTKELAMLGLDASAITWEVRVANLKVFRRTGRAADRIAASELVSDHNRHELLGRGTNLRPSRSIPLGSVRYIRPTEAFPEIRLRFTPATGKVFGHTVDNNIQAGRDVYDPTNGTWDNYEEQNNLTAEAPRARLPTAPGGIYAVNNAGAALGYLDDSCDGIVTVRLSVNGQTLSAQARIAAGPPDYAPDSIPVRTVSDELEQVQFGPDVTDVTANEVLDIMRRAFETVRAMGVENQNLDFPFWVPNAAPAFNAITQQATTSTHQNILTILRGLSEPASSPQRAAAHAALTRVAGAVRAWDQSANYTRSSSTQSPGLRQMPALMRGADGGLLALTRRQRAKLLLAVEKFRPAPAGGGTPKEALVRMIQSLQFGASAHSAIQTQGGAVLSQVFADPDKVIEHLLNGAVQGSSAAAVPLIGQPLIKPKDAAGSAMLKIVSTPGHTMQSILQGYTDSVSNKNGFEILADWINSLP